MMRSTINKLATIIVLSLCLRTAACLAEGQPVAVVRTAPLAIQELDHAITGYGTVSAAPEDTTNLNLPYAAQVTRLWVSPGQVVKKGAPLVEVAVALTEATNFIQARSNLEFARAELARVEAMARRQMATRAQVEQAKKGVADAEQSLATQRQLGTDNGRTVLKAPFAGLVSQVGAKPGDRPPAGTSLIQLVCRDQLLAVIGIEPEERGRVRPGMQVAVSSVFDERMSVPGLVKRVFGMVNPQTRLVDVTVVLPPGKAELALGTQVKGVIAINRRQGKVVPRSALLRDANGAYVFVVRDGQAHRVAVTPGLENDGVVEVKGALAAGDQVVTMGNYELKEGMAVREEAGQ